MCVLASVYAGARARERACEPMFMRVADRGSFAAAYLRVRRMSYAFSPVFMLVRAMSRIASVLDGATTNNNPSSR
jgi:hypothetical protein